MSIVLDEGGPEALIRFLEKFRFAERFRPVDLADGLWEAYTEASTLINALRKQDGKMGTQPSKKSLDYLVSHDYNENHPSQIQQVPPADGRD